MAIVPGTPAARAGLRKGDILTALDGEPVSDESDLAAVLATRKPGQSLRVTFLRAGKSSSVTLRLAARSSSSPERSSGALACRWPRGPR